MKHLVISFQPYAIWIIENWENALFCKGGLAGLIWEVGFASLTFGTTLLCRALIKMMAATRIKTIVTMKAITTGLIDESPTRSLGVGSLLVGLCSLIERFDAQDYV
jgi:hypothetical protein